MSMDLLSLQAQGSLETPDDNRPEGNLVERIYKQVKEEIFEFFLLPGDRFTESELAARVQASRTPVREALFRLQQEGYLEVRFRNGWQVKPIDFRQFEELYDIRVLLETEGVKHIAKADAEQRKMAVDSLAQIWLAPESQRKYKGADILSCDEHFHETIVATMGNREMTRIHRSISERIRIIKRLDFAREDRLQATYEEHAAIIRALIEGDTQTAAAVLTEHIKESKKVVYQITLHKLHMARENRSLPKT